MGNIINMSKKEAMTIVVRGAQKYLTGLKKQRDNGPEGIEVHLAPFIEDLEKALYIVQH